MTITGSNVLQRDPGATVVVAPYGPRGPIIAGTSLTPVNIANGPVTFEMTEYGLGFAPGIRVRATATEGVDQWVEGVVTAYSAAELDVMVDLHSGSDIYYSWQITVAGEPGEPGPQGPKGDTGQVPEAPMLGIKYARLDGQWANITIDFAAKAPIESPVFTGNPQRAAVLDTATNDQSLATTVFVKTNIAALSATASTSYQPIDADLTSLAGAGVTGKLYYRKSANTWVALTTGSGISIDTGTDTINVTAGGGNVSNSGTPVLNEIAQWASTNTLKSLPISGLYNGVTFTGTTTISGPSVHNGAATFNTAVTFNATPVTAQTPASTYNDNQVATTAFVRSVVQDTYGVRGLTGSIGSSGTNAILNMNECLVRNAARNGIWIGAMGQSMNLAAVGPNGCDVALVDGDVHFYALWGVTPGGTLIASNAHPQVGPALPSGFTHWGYLTTAKRAGGNFYYVAVRGNKIMYANAPSVVANANVTAWTGYSMATYLPAIATNVLLNCTATATTSGLGGGALVWYASWTPAIQYRMRLDAPFAGMNVSGSMQCVLPNVTQTVYAMWAEVYGIANFAGNGLYIDLIGYEVPNGD